MTGALTWYRNFSHSAPIPKNPPSQYFTKADGGDVDLILDRLAFEPIESHRYFLREIGYGLLKKDASGVHIEDFYNYFLSAPEIEDILSGRFSEWRYATEHIDDGEMPFFVISSVNVLVFRKGHGDKVFYPHSSPEICSSFDDFIERLMTDCRFYLEL